MGFSKNFQQEILSLSEVEGEESFREDQLTQLFIDYLCELGELDDGHVCSYRGRGMQVNGYSFSEELDHMVLFVTGYTATYPPESVRKNELEAATKRVLNFYKKCTTGIHTTLEEASPIFDLALQIYESKDTLTALRIYYITDGLAKVDAINELDVNGMPVTIQIWDIERLYRSWSSGQKREIIEINVKDLGSPISCLPMPEENQDYMTYLAVFPGEVLVNLYGKYGPRLLERNVRSFLQVRGSVNKGIRSTIRLEPHMFLAYNNGLSAVAESVEMTSHSDGSLAIKSIKDLQIVNGGQTTASIYHAFKNDKADLKNLYVQVKLTVILDANKIDEIVPRISEYANNQNKIQTADFSANDPFHRKMEELSRTVWAPVIKGMQRQTRWFYERARGQYMDEKGRATTPAQKKHYEITHPKIQLFTKTDLAKFENTWSQLPHFVSRGAQKNFIEFTVTMSEIDQPLIPDQRYFECLVAKAILFHRTEKLVQKQKYGGYRANIVTYTLALISYAAGKIIDLEKIWKSQELSSKLEELIIQISQYSHSHIIQAPGNGNVTEWCKKVECWENFKMIKLPTGIFEDLPEAYLEGSKNFDIKINEDISKIDSRTWFDIAAWCKETNNLLPWQRSLAVSIGKLVKQDSTLSIKQVNQAEKIISELERLGYFINSEKVSS
jgi:hypothetical protein